jgi:hypothetical protein
MLSLAFENLPQGEVRAGHGGIGAQGFAAMALRLDEALSGEQDAPEGCVGRRVCGFEGQDSTIRSFCLREAPLFGQHLSQVAVGPKVVGLEQNGILRPLPPPA